MQRRLPCAANCLVKVAEARSSMGIAVPRADSSGGLANSPKETLSKVRALHTETAGPTRCSS